MFSAAKQTNLCDALLHLIPLAQFKKNEKHPSKSIVPSESFPRFLNCINGNKSRKIAQYLHRTKISVQ